MRNRRVDRVLRWPALALAALAVACGGDGAGNAPADASVGGETGRDGPSSDGPGSSSDGPGLFTPLDTGSQQQNKVCWYFCDTVADCPTGAVACKNKACLECTSDSHCQKYPAQKCDTTSGRCVFCTQDSHCTYQGQKLYSGKCDPTYGLCVRCTAAADCNWQNSSSKICHNGLCIQCQSDADCAGATMKRCDTKTGFCNLCKTSAECCPPGQSCALTCDPGTGYCLCSTDTQCSDAYQATLQHQWECKTAP